MPIEFRCTSCGKLLRTADDTTGKQAKCPDCGSLQTVPGVEAASSGSPSASPFGAYAPAPTPAPEAAINPYSSPLAYQPSVAATPAGPLVPAIIDFGDVLGRSWRIYQKQLGMCILPVVVFMGVNFGLSMLFNIVNQIVAAGLQGAGANQNALLAVLVGSQFVMQVVALFVQTWLQLGLWICMLKIARGQAFSVGEMFQGGPYLLRAIVAALLIFLIVLAILVPCLLPSGVVYLATQKPDATLIAGLIGGAIAFIALVFVWLILSQYMPLIVDRNLSAVEALRASKLITAGNKLTLLGIWIVFFFINLGGELACCVGLIFTIPYTFLAMAVVYLAMTSQPTAEG